MSTRKSQGTVGQGLVHMTEAALDDAQLVVSATERTLAQATEPVRKGLLKRFPSLFLLLVTFGVTATIAGIEQLLLQSGVLTDHPMFIVLIGIVILVSTGTLYKKLG